jgi:hypothetical protein
VKVLPAYLGGAMPRRCRTIGTFIIVACVLVPVAHAISDERPAEGRSLMKAEVALAEHSLAVGTAVLAVDGTVVGKVTGLSRNPSGHVERIRVTGIPMGSEQTILIIREKYFRVTDEAVQLNLSVAELDAMPRAMTEDKEAGSRRPSERCSKSLMPYARQLHGPRPSNANTAARQGSCDSSLLPIWEPPSRASDY